MISAEKVESLFLDTISGCKTLDDELRAIKALKGEYRDEIIRMYCNTLLSCISEGYIKYIYKSFTKNELIQYYLKAVKLLPKKYIYYHLTYYFFNNEHNKFLSELEEFIKLLYEESKDEIEKAEDFINEYTFIITFFEPFKQAFDGFWPKLGSLLKKYPAQQGLTELCSVIDEYYKCSTDNDALELLLESMQQFPELVLIRELVGYTYYSMKMWNNAIAYFESVEETGLFFSEEDLYFMIAWSYGKVKNHKVEENYYRKALEIASNNIYYLNNLGYSLYLQKRYNEAKEYLEKCLEFDIDDRTYAANNYVRVLIALGRNKDAKAFIKYTKHKISKNIRQRVEKLDNSNARIKKDAEKILIESFEDEESQKNIVDLGIKRQQFSNEKLLEDELTARIESGTEVFGLKLKMYKRKGVYGRQYIIPVGRLDLLCEDEKGNLYIIELKKDSGYDDAYAQTAMYLDWFEKNDISNGKNVYGIICLNSPTQDLVDKVHNDKRMKLFEYQISYTEI